MLIQCPICFEQASIIYSGYPGYQQPDVFDIARCDMCRTSFVPAEGVTTSPIYEAIYRQVEDVPGYSRYARYSRSVLGSSNPLNLLADAEDVYWGIRHHLQQRATSANVRVLEIGSGLGYLTYALNKAGYQTTGIDISQVAVDRARRLYQSDHYLCADLFVYAETNPHQYDVVILTEVIEHLNDVYPFLRVALKLLAENGDLLITTPNRDAFASDVVWAVEGPPVHLSWFSAHSFKAMAQHLGCSLEFVDLSGFHKANTWTLQHVEGSPCAVTFPVLDPRGELISMTATLKGRAKRVIKTVLRHTGLWDKLRPTAVPAIAPSVTVETHETGPSPRLCALLRNGSSILPGS